MTEQSTIDRPSGSQFVNIGELALGLAQRDLGTAQRVLRLIEAGLGGGKRRTPVSYNFV